jgi:hypothetical protein
MFLGTDPKMRFICPVKRTVIPKTAFDTGNGRAFTLFQKLFCVEQALCYHILPNRDTGHTIK